MGTVGHILRLLGLWSFSEPRENREGVLEIKNLLENNVEN